LRAEEAKRLEALEVLASQVPYWDNIQNVESKLDHITAAVKGQEYVQSEPAVRGHLPMLGFTDKKVITVSLSERAVRIVFTVLVAGCEISTSDGSTSRWCTSVGGCQTDCHE
jgi:P2-related tail formation protein